MAGSKMGSLKRKLGLKGETKPGQMISRMNAIKNGTFKQVVTKHKSSSMMKCKTCGMNYKIGSMHEHKILGEIVKGVKGFVQKGERKIEQVAKNYGRTAKLVGQSGLTAIKRFAGDSSDVKATSSYKKKGIKTTGKSFGKSNKLGGGGRFQQVKHAVAGKKGVTNPAGLAAYIGRKSLGKKKFQQLAAKGK